jgi:hypothetical protein
MRSLDSPADGRRFAVEVLRELEREGPERCRANLPPPYGGQADALVLALVELKERGTVEALASFGQIMTDAIGTRAAPLPELYEGMERSGSLRPYKLKRLVNAGHRLAVLSLRREESK